MSVDGQQRGSTSRAFVAHGLWTRASTIVPTWRSQSSCALQLPLRQRRAEGFTSEALAEGKAERGCEWGGGRTVCGLWALSSRALPTAFFVRKTFLIPSWLLSPTLSQCSRFAVFRREACLKHGFASTLETEPPRALGEQRRMIPLSPRSSTVSAVSSHEFGWKWPSRAP